MKKLLQLVFVYLLIFPLSANADFRKALDALQRIDGIAMMVEVQDAIKTKNNDGLSLFLPTLSTKYKDGEFYVSERTGKNFYMNDGVVDHKQLLGKNYIPELMGYLEQAVALSGDKDNQASLDSLKRQISYVPQKYDPKSYIAPTRKDWEEKAAVGDVRAITELESPLVY